MNNFKTIKKIYQQNNNVMQFFRKNEKINFNSNQAILASYDLQAGSYIQNLKKIKNKKHIEVYTKGLAKIIDNFKCASILEAGVGEATTLVNLIRYLKNKPQLIAGFDISWSRLAYAHQYAQMGETKNLNLFIANLLAIPLLENSFDIVYTSHSIEPNYGREKTILKELYRVTKNYLILLEPSNELGSKETRLHIQKHKYCQNLYQYSKELGFKILEHRLFKFSNPHNQTALIVIEKKKAIKTQNSKSFYKFLNMLACPICKSEIRLANQNLFCKNCALIYPIIKAIPCLSHDNGIMGSHYLKFY